jgi:O-acetyl-ADP-ribose deacetylase (regulator of RNase III)
MIFSSGGVVEIIKHVTFKDTAIKVVKGDITEMDVEALVNAANSHLQHGGGVAGAIVRKGGAVIQQESNRIGFVPVGSCAITTGGKLKAGYVIHAVGPRWGEGDEEKKLRDAVKNSLKLASDKSFISLSMPAISAGIFGFPKERCAIIIVHEVFSFLASQTTSLREIVFCLMDEDIIGFFTDNIEKLKEGG